MKNQPILTTAVAFLLVLLLLFLTTKQEYRLRAQEQRIAALEDSAYTGLRNLARVELFENFFTERDLLCLYNMTRLTHEYLMERDAGPAALARLKSDSTWGAREKQLRQTVEEMKKQVESIMQLPEVKAEILETEK